MPVTGLHSLLNRQLRRHLGAAPELSAPWRDLVAAISESYQAYEADRAMIERSLQLSATEVEQKAGELRAVFDAIPDCLLRVDYQGRVLDYKPGEHSLVSGARCLLRGLHIAATPLAGVAAAFMQTLQSVQTGRQIQAREFELSHAGQARFYEARFIPLGLEQCIVMMRDVTQRQQAEAAHQVLTNKLMEASRLAGMSDVATSVLHHVGNALNSLNVSATVLRESVTTSKRTQLGKATALLPATPEAQIAYLTTDEKGRHWADYIVKLDAQLQTEQQSWMQELATLEEKLGHIKALVAMHQCHVRAGGIREPVALAALVEDAVQMSAVILQEHQVQLQREFAPVPVLTSDRYKLLQIVTHLLRNAAAAVARPEAQERSISLRLTQPQPDRVCLSVRDYGVGLDQAQMAQIFTMTPELNSDGRGLGLHSSANAARELGGQLTVHSAGPGQGACFHLELPVQTTPASDPGGGLVADFALNPEI